MNSSWETHHFSIQYEVYEYFYFMEICWLFLDISSHRVFSQKAVLTFQDILFYVPQNI